MIMLLNTNIATIQIHRPTGAVEVRPPRWTDEVGPGQDPPAHGCHAHEGAAEGDHADDLKI